MHFHQNHCWCSKSHWDGEVFDCSYMVGIDKFSRQDYKTEQEDWHNLVEMKRMEVEDVFLRIKNVPFLKQEVIDWLNENVKDNQSSSCKGEKGWCMGNDEYRSTGSSLELTLFFYRRSDAMKFIKRWSVHKKPTTYLNYFKDDYKELKDGKLVKVTRG